MFEGVLLFLMTSCFQKKIPDKIILSCMDYDVGKVKAVSDFFVKLRDFCFLVQVFKEDVQKLI